MAVIILLSGKARSGKNTFSSLIKDKYSGEFSVRELAFADTVKIVAKNSFGWNGVKDEAGRTLLQTIGEGGRSYNKDIWVNHLKERIENLEFIHYNRYRLFNNKAISEPLKPLMVLITDCRYLNEMDFMDGTDNLVIKVRILRDIDNHLTAEQNNHPSETSLDNYTDFDMYVENDGSIEDLKKYLVDIEEVVNEYCSNRATNL